MWRDLGFMELQASEGRFVTGRAACTVVVVRIELRKSSEESHFEIFRENALDQQEWGYH
jgi:hypothetical protein